MTENVDMRRLPAYPKALPAKTDYAISPNEKLVSFLLCMHNRYDAFKDKVNQKYNATNHFLFTEKVQNLTGFQRLGCLFLTTYLSRKVAPRLPGSIKSLQIKKLSPLVTTSIFTGHMFLFFPDFSHNALNTSKATITGKYAQFKEQQAINAALAKARAEEEAKQAAENAKIEAARKEKEEQNKKEREES